MLLPVLDVKLEKYHLETTVARISVLSLMNTISSLRVTVEFFQAEPVGDIIKETVNAQTLQGAMSNLAAENGDELPEEFAEVINVYEYLDIQKRKG